MNLEVFMNDKNLKINVTNTATVNFNDYFRQSNAYII